MVLSFDIWQIRGKGVDFDPVNVYGIGTTMFSMKVFHGGHFERFPCRIYKGGKVDFIDSVDADELSVIELSRMIVQLGYDQQSCLYYHFKEPGGDLDTGLCALACDQDIINMINYVKEHKVIEVYVEHDITKISTYTKSPFKKSDVYLKELPSDVVVISPPLNRRRRLSEGAGSSSAKKGLFLEWPKGGESDLGKHGLGEKSNHIVDDDEWFEKFVADFDLGDQAIPGSEIPDVDFPSLDDHHGFIPSNTAINHDNGAGASRGNEEVPNNPPNQNDNSSDSSSYNESSSDSDYEPPFRDEEHEVHDVEVDMRDFKLNTDPNVEYFPYNMNATQNDEAHIDDSVNVDNLNFEEVEQLSSSEDDFDEEGHRKRKRNKVKYRQFLRSRDMEAPEFYLGQEFGTAEEVREALKIHSIQTRRQLWFKKNDNIRIRCICEGTTPTPGDREDGSDTSGDEENEPAAELPVRNLYLDDDDRLS